jgi:general secretion pathway protein K
MHYKTKGVVLISVLLTVLLLSSIAVVIGNNYFVSFKRAQYLEFQTVSLNIFSSIESLALKKIDNELRFNSKVHANNNALFSNDFIFETQKGLVSGKIIDASNCFNINALVKKTKNTYKPNKENIVIFERLLIFSEVENNLIDEAIDQIIDWIDEDDNPRAFGLEDYYYSGPLNNPKEYTSARIFYSIQEIKSLPAIRDIGWQVFEKYFCALPHNDLSININTITGNKSLLLSSLFENLPYSDAEYVIDNVPEDGIKNLNELSNLFPSYKLEKSQNYLNFSSSHFELVTSLSYESYYSESKSKIYYGANNNSYIISRIYNGI